jgi:ABC-2 type transport system ATP-binding protein
MTSEECRPDQLISFENVSRFYGEILGVNRVNLTITPGITSLVGPNGSGKTTLMNLMTGLIQPTRGRVSVLGIPPSDPQRLFRLVGYCGQFDSFPKGMTGYQFINSFLRVHGYERKVAEEMSWQAIERVGLVDAADRKVAGYSKGMRQRIRLAQSIAHQPVVMVLDEPLNGLDPMARAETIRLFRDLAREGLHLIISSHILHEVDTMSDRVVLINNGYILAEGGVTGVREEIEDHPMQIMVGCDRPRELAAQLFAASHIVEVQLYSDREGADPQGGDRRGLLIRTTNADAFFLQINQIVTESDLAIDLVMPVDDDLSAVYHYLIGSSGGGEA